VNGGPSKCPMEKEQKAVLASKAKATNNAIFIKFNNFDNRLFNPE